MPHHFLDLEGAVAVNTASFSLGLRNVEAAIQKRAITLFLGPAGAGKSFTADACMESLSDGHACYVKVLPTANPTYLANQILRELTGVHHDLTRYRAADALKRHLAADPQLVVLDEAQNASLLCIEFIRCVHEEVPGRFPMLLSATNHLLRKLRRARPLARRIKRPTPFEPIKPPKVVAVMKAFHPIYHDAESALINDVNTRCCHGNFGDWASFTDDATDHLRDRELDTLDDAAVEYAIRQQAVLGAS